MSLSNIKAITDICLLVEDVHRTIEFYTKKLGFEIRSREEGFVDFHGPGVILAAWEIDHISKHVGISNKRAPTGTHKACVAVQSKNKEVLDALYEELKEKGVEFSKPPQLYKWKAYCAYFEDPDENVWEIYTWMRD